MTAPGIADNSWQNMQFCAGCTRSLCSPAIFRQQLGLIQVSPPRFSPDINVCWQTDVHVPPPPGHLLLCPNSRHCTDSLTERPSLSASTCGERQTDTTSNKERKKSLYLAKQVHTSRFKYAHTHICTPLTWHAAVRCGSFRFQVQSDSEEVTFFTFYRTRSELWDPQRNLKVVGSNPNIQTWIKQKKKIPMSKTKSP